MNRSKLFVTESEQNFIELEEDMQLLPWQEEKRDFRLAGLFSYYIREQLREKDSVKLKFASSLAINALATELAGLAGRYQLSVMPYGALYQAWCDQKFRIKQIGDVNEHKYFALIDEDARVIGVHIPMPSRLIVIDSLIDDAVKELKKRLLNRLSVQLDKELEALLRKQLRKQRYPNNIPHIRISPVKENLLRDKKKRFKAKNIKECKLSDGRHVQLFFKRYKNSSVMYYHIL